MMIKMVSTITVSEFEWNRWMNVTSSITLFFAFNSNNGLKWWRKMLLLLLPHLHTKIEFTNRLFLALPRIFLLFFFRCAKHRFCFDFVFCKIKVQNTTKELQTVERCSLDLIQLNVFNILFIYKPAASFVSK